MCHYVYEQNAVNTAKIRLFIGGSYRPISKLLARRVSFSGRRSSIKALTEVIIVNSYTTKTPKKQEVKTYSVSDIQQMLNISRSSAYQLTQQGLFKVVRIGKTIRISKKSFDEWLEETGIE